MISLLATSRTYLSARAQPQIVSKESPYHNINLKSYGRRAFSVAAPHLWNGSPEDIKNAGSISVYKRKLNLNEVFKLEREIFTFL